MDLKTFENLEKLKNGISKGLNDWDRYRGNRERYDKIGLGFNQDSRFSSMRISLSLDSWYGVYGNSSCSSILSIHDKELFYKYFLNYLNKNITSILSEILSMMEADFEENKRVKIDELTKQLEYYQSFKAGATQSAANQ